MKSHKRANGLLFIVAVCAIASIIFSSKIVVGNAKRQTQRPDDNKELILAIRRDGMKGAAKLKGQYVAEVDPHWDFGAFNAEELTKNSGAVVVAVVGSSLGGHVTPSGQSIATDYQLVVEESIKGKINEGSTVTLRILGGRVQFEDGTTAELRTPTFEPVIPGARYLFFLTEPAESPGTYELSGGPQGLLELRDDGSVKSHGRSTDPIAMEAKDKDKASFLKQVREQAKKWPNKGKCCG